MDGLFRLCHNEHIDVEYVRLTRSGRMLGWYLPAEEDAPPTILLDVSLHQDRRRHRVVLAEELGHHYTVPTSSLASGGLCAPLQIPERSNRTRDEGRAVRWAARHLIPTMALAQAAREGHHTVHDLAEYFCVTDWLVHRRLRILRSDLRKSQGLRVHVRELFAPILVDALWGLDVAAGG